jgi:hypothetical protein
VVDEGEIGPIDISIGCEVASPSLLLHTRKYAIKRSNIYLMHDLYIN